MICDVFGIQIKNARDICEQVLDLLPGTPRKFLTPKTKHASYDIVAFISSFLSS